MDYTDNISDMSARILYSTITLNLSKYVIRGSGGAEAAEEHHRKDLDITDIVVLHQSDILPLWLLVFRYYFLLCCVILWKQDLLKTTGWLQPGAG